MKTRLKMVYWKSDKFWVGKLVDHPEIMTQGETRRTKREYGGCASFNGF